MAEKIGGEIPGRALGRTGIEVSALALGGYNLGLVKTRREAIRIVQEAFAAGITFMDNAWEYHDGLSEEIMGQALVGRRHNAFVMTKVCTHGRDRKTAMRQLHQSLRRLKTDYLDLWQIHEVVYDNDPDLHFAKGGAVEALDQAKREGKVRFVGFTGHKDPAIHLKMLAHDYPFDACQMPLNVLDGTLRLPARAGFAGAEPAWHCAAGNEKHVRARRDHQEARRYSDRSSALCDEPASGNNC